MAELTFKSAGVSTREIDLSGPTPTGPQGTPAGIIGTSPSGPAFVPVTFATFSEFTSIFGGADGEKFGPIAVSEWLKSARACTYIRVLGIGDGKQRDSSSGVVTNAGFVVGDRKVQDNGYVGNNKYGNTGAGSHKGRTYFLGCFMSESNGSTIFSEAGIQTSDPAAAAASVNIVASNAPTPGTALTIVTTDGTSKTFQCHATDTDGTTGTALFARTGAQHGINNLKTAIEASSIASKVTVSSVAGSDPYNITITQNVAGTAGNRTITSNVDNYSIGGAGSATAGAFTKGFENNHAVPILRGVLLAPSGVILHLSGNGCATTTAPAVSATAAASDDVFSGRTGGITGSVDLTTKEFVMLMNGYKGDASNLTHLTASFDMTAPNYFPNVFNTDPLKIEEKGHYLYSHYDIYPTLAAVTGTGATAKYSVGSGVSKQDIGFILTSSVNRSATSFGNVPAYEDFQDRFSAAFTPFVISQEFDRPYNLFKVVALNDGKGEAEKLKVSIENISRATSDTNKFGKFDLVVRQFVDSDDEKKVLESFRGLSLDPGSDRYVARAVGDQNIFFNFDASSESQKIVVDGTHPVRSRYIRVKMSDEMVKKEVPQEALPMGYRGPNHLVTSGTMLTNDVATYFMSASFLSRVVEPPLPYRDTIALGTGLSKKVDSRYYWGMQTTRKTSATEPNKPGLIDESWRSFVKYFPTHRKDTTAFSVGNNAGAAMANGAILDSDVFNNNIFTLERVQVVTASDGFADSEQWLSASYIRKGGIVANHPNKTRKFKVTDLDRAGNRKYIKFTMPLQGGFDGTDMFNSDKSKLTNVSAKREMDDESAQGGTSGQSVAAFRKAVDVMGSKSDVEIQLLATPGMRHTSITDYAISSVEGRFDAMYIMDIEERDQVNTVITSSVQKPHVLNTVTDFKNRALDTSFAAAYFPDVTIKDPATNALIQVPPSVAVLGAYGLNDRIGHPWFAPAGFTRGALSAVETASVKLNRTNLDDLYDSDINPISAFPGTGLTVWGQKTCLQASSALDRVNVRRLLISVRRSVRNVANTLLFEPNREETLEKFTSLVNPILQRVQELSGVDRYKVIIDTTTTTQADVENNTIRGKIFLQPTRAVEFVALDFVVTNAGSELL